MRKVCVAILWHQHQPMYKTRARVAAMPWTRLHAIKDYIGMGLLAARYPEMHHVINFVPSLIDQMTWYADGTMSDLWLEHSLTPAADLSEDQRRFILRQFFVGTWDRMVRIYPRYGELLDKSLSGGGERALRRFTTQDFLDLQVWNNLAWYHPLVVEQRPELRGLIEKGRDFTEGDKRVAISVQREVIAQVVPLHRKLQDQGAIEVSVTPYFHPILPLLCRMGSARVALPDLPLPAGVRESWEEDARWHTRSAVEHYERFFGRKARGMWPSEGSVAPEILPIVAEAGLRWLASDEEVLAASIGASFSRDDRGRVSPAELLYVPYEVRNHAPSPIRIVFRDHYLSDRIGFEYSRWTDSREAARDLISRIEQVSARTSAPPLVSIILDGENAWEFYDRQGVPFLSALYEGLVASSIAQPTTVSAYLDTYGPQGSIDKLFSGSWIGHNFATWVGHREKNAAWELLAATRRTLFGNDSQVAPEKQASALPHFHAAEGSDWFWWYGDDHSTAYKNEFDANFRQHLIDAYSEAGLVPPERLSAALVHERPLYVEPSYLLSVTIDGRITSFFEWRHAGHYSAGRDQAVMHRTSGLAVSDLYYGASHEEFLLRLDPDVTHGNTISSDWKVRVVIGVGRSRFEIEVSCPPAACAEVCVTGPTPDRKVCSGKACRGRILEVAMPWSALELTPGKQFTFAVEILIDGKVVQTLPEQAQIQFECPAEGYEGENWVV